MKKTMKVISILMTVLMIISIVTPVLATTIGDVTINPSYTGDAKTSTTLNTVLGMIKYLGIFLAVGILMFLGIKYMMGSASEKAEYKKTMIPFIVGVVLLFAAAVIVQIIQSTTMQVIQ